MFFLLQITFVWLVVLFTFACWICFCSHMFRLYLRPTSFLCFSGFRWHLFFLEFVCLFVEFVFSYIFRLRPTSFGPCFSCFRWQPLSPSNVFGFPLWQILQSLHFLQPTEKHNICLPLNLCIFFPNVSLSFWNPVLENSVLSR